MTLLLSWMLAISTGQAQTRYEQEMKSALEALDKADNAQNFQAVANKFEMISRVEKAKWLPKYYASLSYTLLTYFEKEADNKDKALESAQKYLDMAKAQSADKEETAILQVYINQSSFFVSPMSRLKTFMQTTSALDDLLKQYPDNPRVNLLLGIQLFHKPAMLGGGASKAKPYFQKANSIFDRRPVKDVLLPAWGKDTNSYYLNKCS